ncbi:LLM class F420-dependent oxidoreductase [Rhodococcus sp. ABRD24]|uniref:LLM class F420-dependent oxidoreductase n=1 Tax=Rhodococcus sp. ABRD24 TaxID=2507582 RepID=UPI00103F34D5|nr:LLM class F420-dependent oxidoreductase [Rhodococcus sp. ABRD24]QBJ96729.1 LLM class F420-dependent oxidoreductase [Rhodococcus sp. ABRD24]
MRYGISLFTSDRGITPAAAARAVEGCGFDALYVPEHTHIPVNRESNYPGTDSEALPDDRYMRTLDPWVALATAAAVTSRIRLGTSVALPLEHDPITLAKTIASLDHLSGGRVTFGVGYGWNTEELADHGIDPKKRRTALREYLEAMNALWTKEEASYDGQFVKFDSSWAWPKPIQQPRPPVLVGAGASEKTFAWIARSADGWITTPIERDIEENVALLNTIWIDAGRSGRPEIVVLSGKPDADRLARWEELGVSEAMFGTPDAEEAQVVAYLQRLAGRLGIGG